VVTDDPVELLLSRSNGIFLWVKLVLKGLTEAHSKEDFEAYLSSIGEIADLNKSYLTELSRLPPAEIKWVKEVCLWVLAAKRALTVEELRSAVEGSLNTQYDCFTEFLQVQCGSLLTLVKIGNDEQQVVTVQFVHETFRSFLVDSKRFGEQFYFSQDEANAHVGAACVHLLCAPGAEDKISTEYCAAFMVDHLLDSKMPLCQYPNIVLDLQTLFDSGRVELIVVYAILSINTFNFYNNHSTSAEDSILGETSHGGCGEAEMRLKSTLTLLKDRQ
jgi:hypothetical protein